MKIKKIIKSEYEGEYRDTVTLTMTCSKRLHLFKKTLPSFVDNCQDLYLVTKIVIFDDSSPEEDRYEMEKLAEQLFPTINIDFVYFNDIPTKHRHAYIMQHWFNALKTNFVFHLEDDRMMIDKFSLKECIDLIKNDWELYCVNFAQTLREFPETYLQEYKNCDFGKNKEIIYPKNNNYWIWPYVDNRGLTEIMFYDTLRCKEGSADFGFDYWEQFTNYPPFGLQPSVFDVNKLKLIGNFELVDTLEASYGLRVYKKFYAICSLKRKSFDLGNKYLGESSSYDLNSSTR